MPDLTTWGGYPYPTGPEAADVPADMMALAQSLDPHTVLTAASQADRDARYASVPAGVLVTCAAAKTVWLSLGGGNWSTLYSDTGWITSGFTLAPGWSGGSGACKMRRVGVIVNVTVQLTWTGLTLDAADVEQLMVTMATNRPSADQSAVGRSGITSGTVNLSSATGQMLLKDLHTGTTLLTGQYIQANFTYMAD